MDETTNTGEDTAPGTKTTPLTLEGQIYEHIHHRIKAVDVLLDIARTYEVIGEHRVANDAVAQRIAAIDAGTAQLLAELRERRSYYRKA